MLGRSAVPLELRVAGRRQAVETSAAGCSIGGGSADPYLVPGLQRGALRIHLEGSRVLVVARGPAWLRGVRLRAGAPVLLSPGDELRLTRRGRIRLVHLGEAPPVQLATRSLLRRLLAGAEPGSGLGVPRLLCVAGPDLGRWLLVPPGSLELGRAAGCGLRLVDPAVARRQARLRAEGERVHLDDLGSYGGTRVNGRRLHRTRSLAAGDLIGAGRTLLRFVEAARPPGTAPVALLAPPRRWARFALGGAALALAAGAAVAAIRLAPPRREPFRSAVAPGRPAPPGVPPAGGGARRSW